MKKAFVLLAMIGVAVTAVRADTVAYSTDFNAPTYSDGGLIGQDSWANTATSTTNPINVSNTSTNGVANIVGTGQDVKRLFASSFDATTASSFTLSADINFSAAGSTGDYFLHVSDGGASNFNDRVYAKAGSVAGTFDLGLGTGSGGTIIYGADLNLGTTYNISAIYNFVAGATNDTATLLVNGSFYVAGVTTGTDAGTIAAVNIRQGTTGPSGTVDNISVTFAPVPEPSTLALVGIGLAGAASLIRRKNAKS